MNSLVPVADERLALDVANLLQNKAFITKEGPAALLRQSDPLLAAVAVAQKRKFDAEDVHGDDDDDDDVIGYGNGKGDYMLDLLAKAADEMDLEGGEIDADETSGSASGSVSPTPIQSNMTYTYITGKNAGSTDTGSARKEKTLYRCDVCGWSTVQLARYLKHKTASHAKRTEWTIRFSCHKCAFSTPLKSVLEDHERTKHANGNYPSTTPMDLEKASTFPPVSPASTTLATAPLPTLYSGQRPLVISLPPAGSPPTASRGTSVGAEKLFDLFLEAVLREESGLLDRMSRLQTTLSGLTTKNNTLKEEVGCLTGEMGTIESDILSSGYKKQTLIALLSVTVGEDGLQREIDALESKILTLKENLTSLHTARDLAIKQSVDVETQLTSLASLIDQSKPAFQNIRAVKSEFVVRKNDVDTAKHRVDDLYKDILVTFARKNDLELKRIMDPALDDKDALELLSTRHRIENDLQTKVSAFIELRTKWNNGRSALAQFVHANKTRVVDLAA